MQNKTPGRKPLHITPHSNVSQEAASPLMDWGEDAPFHCRWWFLPHTLPCGCRGAAGCTSYIPKDCSHTSGTWKSGRKAAAKMSQDRTATLPTTTDKKKQVLTVLISIAGPLQHSHRKRSPQKQWRCHGNALRALWWHDLKAKNKNFLEMEPP